MQGTRQARKGKAPEESPPSYAVYSKTEAAMAPPELSAREAEAIAQETERILMLLDGRLRADTFDEPSMLIGRIARKTGHPSDDFLEGYRRQETIDLPHPKEDEDDFIGQLEEIARKQAQLPPHERSHIHIEVIREEEITKGGKKVKGGGRAVLTDTSALPAPILREPEKYAELFGRILQRGDPALMLTAIGCWNAMKTSIEEGIDISTRVQYYHKSGEHDIAELGETLGEEHRKIAHELGNRLKLLAGGAGLGSRQVQASIARTDIMEERVKHLNSRNQDLQVLAVSRQLMGRHAMERIEVEISRKDSYYNPLEIAAYEGIKRALKDAATSMRSLSTAGLEKIPIAGMNGLTAKEKNVLRHVMSLVVQLEFIAWKADMRELKNELQQGSAENLSQKTPFTGRTKRSKLSMAQLTGANRAKVQEISYRAKKHVDLMKRFVDSLDPGLLSAEEKKKYKKKFDLLKEGVEPYTGMLASLDESIGPVEKSAGKKKAKTPYEEMGAGEKLWEALGKEGFPRGKFGERYRMLEAHVAGEDDSVSPFVATKAAVGLLEKGLRALGRVGKKGFGGDFEAEAEAAKLRRNLEMALGQNQALLAKLEAEKGAAGSLRKGLHTFREKMGMGERESRTGLEVTTLSALEAASRDVDRTMDGVARLLNERSLERKAQDPGNPWHVRAATYTKVYTYRYSLAVLAGGTAAGGVAGGFLFRSPGGVWTGMKTGAKIASKIVAAAGGGMVLEGGYRYAAGKGDREQALEDMRIGSTYLAFGLFGAPTRILSSPLHMGIAAGVVAPNALSLLTSDHFGRGEYLEIASDVAYVVIGTTAFIRTATGAFRMIKLGKEAVAADAAVVANASGVAKLPLGTRIAERMVRVHEMGYSGGWVTANIGFSGIAHHYDILEAIDNGNYEVAASILGRGFMEFTRDMVTFDFALAGLGGGVKAAGAVGRAGRRLFVESVVGDTGARAFRATIPKAHAKFLAFLHRTGTYERVADFASAGGLNMKIAQNNARLLELAFASGGKVSPKYVQTYLGLKSIEQARKIAVAIRHDWKMARAAFSKAGSGTARAWRWAAKKMKSRMGRIGTGVAIASLITYHTWQSSEEEANAKELENLLTLYELEFIGRVLSGPNDEIGASQVDPEELYEAIGLVREISDRIDGSARGERITMEFGGEGSKSSGLFILDPALLKFGGDKKKRKWLLSACALALLMDGQGATEGAISSLAVEVQKTAARNGIDLAYRPLAQGKNEAAYSMHFGTVALMALSLLRGRVGAEEFTHAYSSFSRMHGKKKPQGALQDYAITSIFAATAYGKGGKGVSIPLLQLAPSAAIARYRSDAEWHARAALSLFEGTRPTPHHNRFGWELLFALGSLETGEPSREEIDDAFADANGKINFWGK